MEGLNSSVYSQSLTFGEEKKIQILEKKFVNLYSFTTLPTYIIVFLPVCLLAKEHQQILFLQYWHSTYLVPKHLSL